MIGDPPRAMPVVICNSACAKGRGHLGVTRLLCDLGSREAAIIAQSGMCAASLQDLHNRQMTLAGSPHQGGEFMLIGASTATPLSSNRVTSSP